MSRPDCFLQQSSVVFIDPFIDCFCKKLLDIIHVGILVTDHNGTIKYLNQTYSEMFSINFPEALNSNICNYFPNSRLLAVIATGIPDEGVIFPYKDQDAFISRFPIFDGGKVIGGLIEVYSRDITLLSKVISKLNSLEKQVNHYKRISQGLPRSTYTLDDIIGESEIINQLKANIIKFAKSNHPILIQGESGSGKELVAHSIHAASPRSNEIFVSVNCAAIPKDLMEAEIFGFEEGTFTGAKHGGRVGKFELADRGSIFLDEIAEFPLSMQATLLRVIDNKEIQKIGKSMPTYSNFRLITATNKDLHRAVEEGKFRIDLYHRLAALVLRVPPLRERRDDIPLIITKLISLIDEKPRTNNITLSADVLKIFNSYSWPGNIREMKNILSFALLSLESGASEIQLRHLPPYIIENTLVDDRPLDIPGLSSLVQARQNVERKVIIFALQRAGQNKAKAARILGISRNELYKKLRKLEVNAEREE